MIFSTLTRVDVDPLVFVDMSWASLATHLAFVLIGALVLRAARLPLSVYLNGMVYPNAGNIGLPLCFVRVWGTWPGAVDRLVHGRLGDGGNARRLGGVRQIQGAGFGPSALALCGTRLSLFPRKRN